MDIQEVWQSPEKNHSTRDDLRKYQAQYLRILSRTLFLNDRYFQTGATILMTICALVITYISPYRPYSIIWGIALVVMQWYVFVLYERLRARIEVDADESDPVAYFSRKRDVITQIAYIRMVTLTNSILIFLAIWATRTPERLFDDGAISLWVCIGLMATGFTIHYRLTIIPVMNFLKDLVKQLEEKQGN
jgi:hypothetical protein